jgi:rRNA maturation protein Nop10
VVDADALRTALAVHRDEPDRLIDLIVQQAILVDQQATLIEQLQARIGALEAQVRDLTDRNQRLQRRVDELERAAARPAAPFRIKPEKRCSTPQRPGRPVGHPGVARPVPLEVDAVVDVPLDVCPHCGGAVTDVHPCVQVIEDLPPITPHRTRLTTYTGRCRACGRRVRSTHPLQVSTATGAAGVALGPRALGVAAELNKHLGLTVRSTCRVLRLLGGLTLSPGGLVHGLARAAARLQPAYAALQTCIRASPAVHSDETSWWVGNPGFWLWVFTTPTTTLYHVAAGRGRDVVTTTLGADYAGVLISDCLAIYDGGPPVQHKCYAHHLKAIATLTQEGPNAYAAILTALLRAAMRLKAEPPADAATVAQQRRTLEIAADVALAAPRADPAEERVRRRLAKQRDHLFTFLDHAAVPATNNLAERQLRPAVIARKLSCGNKTPAGARTWEILASLAATCHQRGESFLDLVTAHARPLPAR